MSMWGRYAKGRSVAPRVRGAVAGGKAGRSGDGVSGQGGEVPGEASGGATGIGHAGAPARKPSKYGNRKHEYQGMKFDSRRELDRWIQLVALQRAGQISELERQVVFLLAPPVVIQGRKRPALKYIADFVYTDSDGLTITEDVKGVVTEGYRIKRHLMAAMGLQIKEIR